MVVMVGKTLTLTVHLVHNPISLSHLCLHHCPHREWEGFLSQLCWLVLNHFNGFAPVRPLGGAPVKVQLHYFNFKLHIALHFACFLKCCAQKHASCATRGCIIRSGLTIGWCTRESAIALFQLQLAHLHFILHISLSVVHKGLCLVKLQVA